MAYTLEQLQAMGAKPVEQQKESGSYTFEQLQSMGAKPVESAPAPKAEKRGVKGVVFDIYKGLAEPVANLIARPGQAVQHAIGDTEPIEGKFLGLDITDPYADVGRGKSAAKTVLSDVGRGAETVALGIGGPGLKSVAKEGLKGAVKKSAIQGAMIGAKSGALFGAGYAAEKPETQNFKDVGVGALTGGALGATFGGLTGAAIPVAAKTFGKIKNAVSPTEEFIEKSLISRFTKAVRPSSTGKSFPGAVAKYNDSAVTAIKTIVENKPNLSFNVEGSIEKGVLPKSLSDFGDAIAQTRKSVFEKYNALTKDAAEGGAVVNLRPIAIQLDEVIDNKALGVSHPEAVTYAKNIQERLWKTGKIDPLTAEEIVSNYNNALKSYYRNPSYDTASKAAIDAGVANNLRKSLDTAIESATGKEYQALKNIYGSLKAIEKDVVKRANADANKSIRGLIDYTDIFTGADIINGITTLNPVSFTKGLAARSIKEWYKYMSDPNRVVKKLFESADDFYSKSGGKSFVIPKKINTPIINSNTGMPKIVPKKGSQVNMQKGSSQAGAVGLIASGIAGAAAGNKIANASAKKIIRSPR